MEHPKNKSDEEWQKELTHEQYQVCRLAGTEAPFSGEYADHHEKGTYHCTCCDQPLFRSDHKFDSGTGWPSFTTPFSEEHVEEHPDDSLGYTRTEVTCSNCGAHLGHVFPDGPHPTGLRFCINSISLKFKEEES